MTTQAPLPYLGPFVVANVSPKRSGLHGTDYWRISLRGPSPDKRRIVAKSQGFVKWREWAGRLVHVWSDDRRIALQLMEVGAQWTS